MARHPWPHPALKSRHRLWPRPQLQRLLPNPQPQWKPGSLAGSRACLARTPRLQQLPFLHPQRHPKANAKIAPTDAVTAAMAVNAAAAKAAKHVVALAVKADAVRVAAKAVWVGEEKAGPKAAVMRAQTTGEKLALKDEPMAVLKFDRKAAAMAALKAARKVATANSAVVSAVSAVRAAAAAGVTIAARHHLPVKPPHCRRAPQHRAKPVKPPTTSSAASAAGAMTTAAAVGQQKAPRPCHRQQRRTAPWLPPATRDPLPKSKKTPSLKQLKAARATAPHAHRVSAAAATATVAIDASAHPAKRGKLARITPPRLKPCQWHPALRKKAATSHRCAAATSVSPPKQPPLQPH